MKASRIYLVQGNARSVCYAVHVCVYVCVYVCVRVLHPSIAEGSGVLVLG